MSTKGGGISINAVSPGSIAFNSVTTSYGSSSGSAQYSFKYTGGTDKQNEIDISSGRIPSNSGPDQVGSGAGVGGYAEAPAAGGSVGQDGGQTNYIEPRWFDYISLSVNVAIPTPWTGTLIGWSGQVTLDRYGNLYLAPLGGNIGKSANYVSGSLVMGWLNQWGKPSEDTLKNFLSGHSVNFGVGYWGGANAVK